MTRVHRQSVRTVTRQPSGPLVPLEGNVQSPGAARQTLPLDQVQRTKIGWPVRDDLIKECKQIALDDGKKNYEVLEDLLIEALEQRRQRSKVDQ